MKHNNDLDVIIIGGGPAGMSALLWCAELRLDAILLEKNAELGGQLLRTFNPITNYPGVPVKNGREFRKILLAQIEFLRDRCFRNIEILSLDLEKKSVLLADHRKLSAKAIIIATGVRRRKLGIPGEAKFQNHGVLLSGVASKDQVSDKAVLIVGGGDAALENALILSETAETVFLVHRGKISDFKARKSFVDSVRQKVNVEIIESSRAVSISGRDTVESVELVDDTGRIRALRVDFVLVRIGTQPNSELFTGKLEMDAQGFICVDPQDYSTSVYGIYAIGDLVNPVAPTLSTAAAHAAIATRSICTEIHKNR